MMNHRHVVAIALFPVLFARAAATNELAPAPVFADVAASAQRDLDAAVRELNRIQTEIAGEKLPLARELARLEEELSRRKADYESVSRKADAGNLEVANLRTEIKARQDELQYVGNILDEYARSFDAKLHPVEMQRHGPAIAAAKQLAENNDLSPMERFTKQIEFVGLTVTRLGEALGGLTFQGRAVDLKGAVRDGTFAVIGPVALFRALDGAVAGLALPQSGSPLPLVRPLEDPAINAGLATLVETGHGQVPLDPSRGAALKALVEKFSLVHTFVKGGPIMWPLLLCSVLAFGAVIERVIFLLIEKSRRDERRLLDFLDAVEHHEYDRALEVGRPSRFFVLRVLVHALEHRDRSVTNALLYAQANELKRFQRGIRILDTCITLAPLLGLLGTVTGMMGSFSLIGGELSSPGAITGGISEALIATAFGLGIAITSVIPFNILNGKVEDARVEMETAATRLELLLHPPATMTQAIAHTLHPEAIIPGEPEAIQTAAGDQAPPVKGAE